MNTKIKIYDDDFDDFVDITMTISNTYAITSEVSRATYAVIYLLHRLPVKNNRPIGFIKIKGETKDSLLKKLESDLNKKPIEWEYIQEKQK